MERESEREGERGEGEREGEWRENWWFGSDIRKIVTLGAGRHSWCVRGVEGLGEWQPRSPVSQGGRGARETADWCRLQTADWCRL